jgi:predicted RNase H-like HicB family nuclease
MSRKAKPSTPSRTYTLQVVVEVDEDGKYVAWSPALQACYTQGDTFEEAMKNIHDVIALCLEELHDENKTVELRYPEVIGIRQVEVTV